MTKEQLAAKLNGREYGNEITYEESTQASRDGLVVAYVRDNQILFTGAVVDGVLKRPKTIVAREGVVPNDHKCSCRFCGVKDAKNRGIAIGLSDGYRMSMLWTKVPHATFTISEGAYWQHSGIVFEAGELK